MTMWPNFYSLKTSASSTEMVLASSAFCHERWKSWNISLNSRTFEFRWTLWLNFLIQVIIAEKLKSHRCIGVQWKGGLCSGGTCYLSCTTSLLFLPFYISLTSLVFVSSHLRDPLNVSLLCPNYSKLPNANGFVFTIQRRDISSWNRFYSVYYHIVDAIKTALDVWA